MNIASGILFLTLGFVWGPFSQAATAIPFQALFSDTAGVKEGATTGVYYVPSDSSNDPSHSFLQKDLIPRYFSDPSQIVLQPTLGNASALIWVSLPSQAGCAQKIDVRQVDEVLDSAGHDSTLIVKIEKSDNGKCNGTIAKSPWVGIIEIDGRSTQVGNIWHSKTRVNVDVSHVVTTSPGTAPPQVIKKVVPKSLYLNCYKDSAPGHNHAKVWLGGVYVIQNSTDMNFFWDICGGGYPMTDSWEYAETLSKLNFNTYVYFGVTGVLDTSGGKSETWVDVSTIEVMNDQSLQFNLLQHAPIFSNVATPSIERDGKLYRVKKTDLPSIGELKFLYKMKRDR